MFKFFYKDIINLLRGILFISVMLIAIKWLCALTNKYFHNDISGVYTLFFYCFLSILAIALCKTGAKAIFVITTKKENNKITEGINKNVKYPCRDEKDALLIKISGLYSITAAGNGKNTNHPNFINSIEECDLTNPDSVDLIRNSLLGSYDIKTSDQLKHFIYSLLDEESYEKTHHTDYQQQLSHLYRLAASAGAEITPVSDMTNINAAFNLQRAALLMRTGMTLGLLTQEEWDALKNTLAQLIEENFPSLDAFIHDYMLAVYLFYQEGMMGASMIRERLYGLATLQQNNYFAWRVEELNRPPTALV
ncbi:DUF1266 domain-containing protein [Affinibrenneria salicis]|uniref:DUF1266 domain-containing protein n=1 Tax=Affinibrenneria salicis TaxID=2590031 RepID=A0A5J5FTV0_9GAMM|nr:DUF1266 domain-containing protein [Affinibrenneria salicis]KAA8996624.1 DUF1266 domain-containing protein [Affinibrenneria salicis]